MDNRTEHGKQKPILFTGITPTGTLTIGHYLGVIKHLLAMQSEYQIFLMIADLHALTSSKQQVDYKKNSRELAALIYACGVQQQNCHIFIQSQVKEHVELSYLLASYCSVGKLTNMIQYKEKSLEKKGAVASLLYYPILMAADILLYSADLVIVGKDQKQHLELTTYIANKFNASHKNILKVPKFSIASSGSKIMSLRDPIRKMSKSNDDHLAILDDQRTVERKIMKAETDSEERIYYDIASKPGISNLLTIYSCFADLSTVQVEEKFKNASYADLKKALVEVVNCSLSEIQANFQLYHGNIDRDLSASSLYLSALARDRMQKIKEEINL